MQSYSPRFITRIIRTTPLSIYLFLLVVTFSLLMIATRVTEVSAQEDEFTQLWRNVQRAGSYTFTADITQHTVPAANIYNVGRSSERQYLRMEGETDLRNQAFHMTLWSEGGSVLDANTGIEVRLVDGRTQARRVGEAWEEIGDLSQTMMPQGDFLAFLAGASEVKKLGEETRNGQRITRYSYQVNGMRVAEIMREKLQGQLQKDGALAPDRMLALSPLMAEMTGVGELWVMHDETGRPLPLRQIVNLRFPEKDGVWSASEIRVDFHEFGAEPTLFLPSLPTLSGWLEGVRELLPFLLFGTATGGALFFIVLRRRSRLVYNALAIACILSMLVGPLLKSVYAAQADLRLSARQAEEAARQQEMEMMQSAQEQQTNVSDTANAETLAQIRQDNGLDSDGDGVSDTQEGILGSNPVQIEEDAFWHNQVRELQVDPELDSDGDGLKDVEETLLGTLKDAADSDGDLITDTLEIQGFTLAGKQWVSNPLQKDSNGDGIADTQEWNNPDLFHPTWDSDNDGVPDLQDRDNDGDKVPDSLDISPFTAYSTTYSANNPLELSLQGLTPGKTVFVDFQLRPTNPNHLWYALSSLDWPKDSLGALQDSDNSENDLSLTPMLEVMLSKAPYHLPLTAPQIAVTIRGVQEPGGGFTPTLPIAAASGVLTLTQENGNVAINGKLSRPAFLSLHRGNCSAVGGISGATYPVATTGNGSIVPLSITNEKLSSLARGNYSIWITEQADNGLLIGCGEIPTVPFVGDQMVDRSALEPYQVSVRDVSQDGLVKALYLPLRLIVDKEGGERVAFGGQIPYLVASSEALRQQVRVVWSVQMKNDGVCVSSRLKPTLEGAAYECAQTQDNVSQVIYSYNESWQLTGLDMREDHDVSLAQIYEDPAVDDKLNDDTVLSALAGDLSDSFLAARTNDANVRDLTIGEIARRFERTTNGGVSEEARWGIPNTLRVVTSTFPTLDQMMLGSMSGAKSILNSQFTTHWSSSQPITPTLLNVYEWHYRVFNLDGVGKSASSSYDPTTRQLSVDWSASPVMSKGMLKWLPYSYQNGSWNDRAITDYWDELGRRLQPEFANESDREVAGGKVVAIQLYYLSLYSGVGRTLQIGNNIVRGVDAKRDSEMLLGKTAAGGITAGAKFLLGKYITGALLSNYMWGPTQFNLLKGLYWMFQGIVTKIDPLFTFYAKQVLFKGVNIAILKTAGILAGVLALIALVVGGALFLADKLTGGSGFNFISPVISIILFAVAALGVYSAFSDTITVIKGTIAFIKNGSSALKGAKLDAFMNSTSSLKSAKIAAAIGLIIELALIWGYVLYSVLFGDVAAGNLDLGLLLAFAFAATIVAILYAVISVIPIVGQIIVAILSFIDAAFSVACAIEDAVVAKSSNPNSPGRHVPRTEGGQCFGISTWLTENLTKAFYQKDTIFDFNSPLIKASRRFPQVGNFSLAFADASMGPVVGNQLRYQASLGGMLGPSIPQNVVPKAYEPENIFTTRYYAELSNAPRADITKTVQTTQALPLNWSGYSQVNPPMKFKQQGFVVGFLTYELDRYIVTLDDRLVESTPFSLTHAGINVPFDVYLNFALKLPVYSCKFAFCDYGKEFSESGNSLKLNALYLEVFPATLDEFYARQWGSWSEDGKTLGASFVITPTDFDGDGLKSQLASGTDPNDSLWDSDSDGLSDGFEQSPKDAQTDRPLAYNFDPLNKDFDNDGICDKDELFFRTNPKKADSDNDGLTDSEELYHLDCATNLWTGGWTFTYNVTKTLTTRVNSNPLAVDDDGDGMSDRVEKELHQSNPAAYPFHPGVFNLSPLAFYATSSDLDGYVASATSLVYTATLRNNFATGDRRAEGTIVRTFPNGLGNFSQNGAFDLVANQSATFVDSLSVSGGSQTATINNKLAAEFLTLEQGKSGTPSYQIDVPFALTIDADKPTSLLTSGSHVQAGGFRIIGGTASDPTSPIAGVEVRIDGQTDWSAASGTGGWAYTWQVPTSDGPRTIQTRASDIVGQVEDPVNSIQVIVDGTAPVPTTTQSGNPILSARRNATGQWTIILEGNVSDPNSGSAAGSGVASVEVSVEPRGSGWLAATLDGSGKWQILYPLSNVDGDNNVAADATGQYSVKVRAADKVSNQTATNAYLTYPLRVDTTAPRASLDSLIQRTSNEVTQTLVISRNLILTGTVSDLGSFAAGVQAVEIAFVPAELLDTLDTPSLLLYLNEPVGVSSYINAAPNGVPAQCNSDRCPLNDVAGIYGGAVQFDGSNDVITAPVDISENSLSVSLWFNTTSANGGLFAATSGSLSDNSADRSIYLTNGNLCAYVKGAQEDEICTAGRTYNDGQWHQVVLVLDGATPFRLYVDGQPGATAGTVNSSILTSQSGVAIGYARARDGSQRFFNGRIDEVELFQRGLNASAVAALYRRWQPVTLASPGAGSSTWLYQVPAGLEGLYQIDLRAEDTVGNRNDASRGEWRQWRGLIDTRAPRIQLNASFGGGNGSEQTTYNLTVEDFNLSADGFEGPCTLQPSDYGYDTSSFWLQTSNNTPRLNRFTSSCVQSGWPVSGEEVRYASAKACDIFGHCAQVSENRDVLYWSTVDNAASLSGIRRANLNGGYQRQELFNNRPRITGLDVDEGRGHLYWLERDSTTTGRILRSDLEGGNVVTLPVSPAPLLSQVTFPATFDLVVNPAGGKLYWSEEDKIKWANLDGSDAATLFTLPTAADPRVDRIGRMVVDRTGGKIYFGAIDLLTNAGDALAATGDSQIWVMNADGSNAQVLIDPANLQNVVVIDLTLTQDRSQLYWTQRTRLGDKASSGTGMRRVATNGGTPINLNLSNANRVSFIGILALSPATSYAYLSEASVIHQVEFASNSASYFAVEAPLNLIGAAAGVRIPGLISNQSELELQKGVAGEVVATGNTLFYNLIVRNNGPVSAVEVKVVDTIPANTTFVAGGSSAGCILSAASQVTCTIDRLPDSAERTLLIQVQVNAGAGNSLVNSATISSNQSDPKPENNSVIFGGVQVFAQPTAAPATPRYLYWGYEATLYRKRLDVVGSNEIVVGYPWAIVGQVIKGVTIDTVNNRVYWASVPRDESSSNGYIRRANLDGSGLTTIYTDTAAPWPTYLAINPAAGHLYFTHGGDFTGDAIKRINLDGSGEVTLISNLVNPKGLAVNTLRDELYWSDESARLLRANLDGSNQQTITSDVYAYDLAVDPYADRIYFRTPGDRSIQRIQRSGTGLTTIVLGTGAHGPALDIASDRLYWVDGALVGNLAQAKLDGSASSTIGNSNGRPTSQLALAYTNATLAPTITPSPTATTIPASTPTPLPTPTSGGPPAAERLYWSNADGDILRAPIAGCADGACVQAIVTPSPGTKAGDLAIDSVRGKLYWVNPANKSIQRANLDGSSPTTIVSNLSDPKGITIDERNSLLYWTNFSTGTIQRANLDGSGVITLTTGLTNPVWIELAPNAGRLYFVESNQTQDNRDDRKIRRINLDGSGLADVFVSWPGNPAAVDIGFEVTGLSVNESLGRIYWSDAEFFDGFFGEVHWVSVDGSGAGDLVYDGDRSLRGVRHDRNSFRLYWSAHDDASFDGTVPTLIQRSFAEAGISGQPITPLIQNINNSDAKEPFDLALQYPSPTPQVCAADSYEPDNNTATAKTLALGASSLNHTFHTNSDADWYVLTLSAGIRYIIDTQAGGSLADTLLEIYASNGTSLLASDDNGGGLLDSRITFDASLSGLHYAKVTNKQSNAVASCNSGYRLRLAVASVEAPGRVSGLAPANYTLGLLDSTILTPTDRALLSSVGATMVAGGSYSSTAAITVLTVTVNGVALPVVTSFSANGNWSTSWTPGAEGMYTLRSQARDGAGRVQTTTYPVTVYVDLAAPTVSVDRTVYTQTHLLTSNQLGVAGGVTDNGGMGQVEVKIGSTNWQSAIITGNRWLLPWLIEANQFGSTLPALIRATDKAGRATTITRSFTIDVVGPTLAPISVTKASALRGLVVVAQEAAALDQTLIITWPTASDANGVAGYYAGFTTSATPDINALTFYISAGSHSQSVGEAQIVYGHVVVVDGLGNQKSQTVGPITVDGAPTPDVIGDLTNEAWLNTGGSHLSTDWEVTHGIFANATYGGPQRFFTSWDSQALRLAWSGANWDGDGDLFVYLDSGAGGASTLYNPYATPVTINLPAGMSAKYVVWVQNATTAQLLQNNAGAWTLVSTLDNTRFRHSPGLTELYLPFSLLGISNASSLGLVVVASEEDALQLWAASPDKNPLNSERVINSTAVGRNLSNYALTLHHHWANLALGQVPNAGRTPESDLVLSIKSNVQSVAAGYLESDLLDLLKPNQSLDANNDGLVDVPLPGNQISTPIGNGQSIRYTVEYANRGSQTAKNVVLTLSGLGGLSVAPTLNLGDVAAGAFGTVEFTATVSGAVDGVELQAKVSDGAHGVYEWFWFVHAVDTDAPTDIVLATPNTLVRSGNQVVVGEATDASPLAQIVLNINGALTTCTLPVGSGKLWSCPVTLGDLGGASNLTIQVQVTDIHGNSSGFTSFTLAVDNAPPTVSLDSASESALADGFLNAAETQLGGLVSDDRQAEALEFCEVLESGLVGCERIDTTPQASAIGNWARVIPVGEADGISQTLRFTGIDSVGNRSTPLTRTFRLDSVAPVVTATLGTSGISGVMSDGGGVGAVRLRVVPPSDEAYWINAQRNGDQWSLLFSEAAPGSYTLYVEAVDIAGNVGAAGPFTLVVSGANRVYLPMVMRDGSVSPSGGNSIYLPTIQR